MRDRYAADELTVETKPPDSDPERVLAERLSDDINDRYRDRPWMLAIITAGCMFLGSLLSNICGSEHE